MAFRAPTFFGTFEKRAPGCQTQSESAFYFVVFKILFFIFFRVGEVFPVTSPLSSVHVGRVLCVYFCWLQWVVEMSRFYLVDTVEYSIRQDGRWSRGKTTENSTTLTTSLGERGEFCRLIFCVLVKGPFIFSKI